MTHDDSTRRAFERDTDEIAPPDMECYELSIAAALLRVVCALGAFRVFRRRDGSYQAVASRPDRTIAAHGATPADALIALAARVERRSEGE